MSKTLKFTRGDMVRLYTNQGYAYVEDNVKCKQDVGLILTSGVRNTTGLGCGLDELIGDDTLNPVQSFSEFPVIFDFQQRVRVGLSRLRSAQRQYLYDQRPPKELIFDFSPANIWRSAEDPRNYKWKVDVITEEGKSSFSISGGARV